MTAFLSFDRLRASAAPRLMSGPSLHLERGSSLLAASRLLALARPRVGQSIRRQRTGNKAPELPPG